MIKLSANLSLLFTEKPLINRFQAAKEAGFDAVEIQFPYTLTAQAISEQLEKNQLKLVLFNLDADDLLQGGEGLAAIPEKKSAFLRALEQCQTYAEVLRPFAINILPGCCHNPKNIQSYHQQFIDNLKYAVDCFAPLGVKTVFEAINIFDMPGFIIHNEQQMLQVLQQVNHPMLAVQYDIYHMQRMKQNWLDFIHHYSTQIGHIQFADVPGRHQPGTGQINFSQLFQQIEQSNYQGWVGAEYIPLTTTEQSLDWFPWIK